MPESCHQTVELQFHSSQVFWDVIGQDAFVRRRIRIEKKFEFFQNFFEIGSSTMNSRIHEFILPGKDIVNDF